MNTQHLLQKISFFTILLSLIFLFVVAYWLLFPYKTSTYNPNPQKVNKHKVQGGEYIIIYVDLCKYTEVMPIVSRSFVDGIIYQIPSYVGVDNKMGCHILPVQVYIPKGLPVGKYYIQTNYLWQVNPIRQIKKSVRTEQFEVIN